MFFGKEAFYLVQLFQCYKATLHNFINLSLEWKNIVQNNSQILCWINKAYAIISNEYSTNNNLQLYWWWSHYQDFGFCFVQLKKVFIHPISYVSKAVHDVHAKSLLLKCYQELLDELMIISKSFNIKLSFSNMWVEQPNINLEQNEIKNGALSNTKK